MVSNSCSLSKRRHVLSFSHSQKHPDNIPCWFICTYSICINSRWRPVFQTFLWLRQLRLPALPWVSASANTHKQKCPVKAQTHDRAHCTSLPCIGFFGSAQTCALAQDSCCFLCNIYSSRILISLWSLQSRLLKSAIAQAFFYCLVFSMTQALFSRFKHPEYFLVTFVSTDLVRNRKLNPPLNVLYFSFKWGIS